MRLGPTGRRGRNRHCRVWRIGHEQSEIFRFPAHGIGDTVATAWVIEKYPFFYRSRTHLSVLAEMDRSLGEAIGLAAGVQAVHVGFVFLSAGKCVVNRGPRKGQDRDQQHCQWQYRWISNITDLPPAAPACQRPVERPVEIGKEEEDHDEVKRDALVDVMQNVVA